MSAVTREDRLAAVASVFGAEDAPDVAFDWADNGDDAPLLNSDAIGRDKCYRRANEFADHRERSLEALRRENARLRELLARIAQWTHEHGKALCPTAGSADTFGDGMRAAKQQVSAHLAGAAVPAEARVFAKGDEVQCTGNRFSNPPNTVTAHGCVIAPKSHNDSVLVDFGERYCGTWLVHPRDLVLVRKAKP